MKKALDSFQKHMVLLLSLLACVAFIHGGKKSQTGSPEPTTAVAPSQAELDFQAVDDIDYLREMTPTNLLTNDLMLGTRMH